MGLRYIRLLLLVPYLALIWVPFYNRALPDAGRLSPSSTGSSDASWIVLGAGLALLPVYLADERHDKKDAA